MSLIQSLPAGPLDIVGDIHGEYDALCSLMDCLGYDAQGDHPNDRTLVFVGDFCDRGPDSPAVLARVQKLVESGRAAAVLGNHEINLLREDSKDGSGWFFDARIEQDHDKYAPYQRPGPAARPGILAFLSTLPIGLERADLRVIHAAWQGEQIKVARGLLPGSVRLHYDGWEQAARQEAAATELEQRMAAELESLTHGLENRHRQPPFLQAHAEFEAAKQMMNPLKVLTSGVERKGTAPFYAGGKWRFVQRVPWWDEYDDPIPVVVGHYWRRLNRANRSAAGKGDPDLFDSIPPLAWHGRQCSVFCVDFSAGGRWTERKAGTVVGQDFKLAALRWPERIVQFDDGHQEMTQHYRASLEPAGRAP